ncbi:hypothetical protein L1987_47859 [Smallanthus sonchifolius]|uniref:Uncharacterized protein n=1 Tax=Smallanthus sonchifolius TaxID=185202 RepID=A0ACB9FPQ1_9ASTR|nr:hypothetical protein L1987_47859 [Smallanthus sonchifolius]
MCQLPPTAATPTTATIEPWPTKSRVLPLAIDVAGKGFLRLRRWRFHVRTIQYTPTFRQFLHRRSTTCSVIRRLVNFVDDTKRG